MTQNKEPELQVNGLHRSTFKCYNVPVKVKAKYDLESLAVIENVYSRLLRIQTDWV